jgi:hypothetical protein
MVSIAADDSPTDGLDVRRQVIFTWVATTTNTSVCVA